MATLDREELLALMSQLSDDDDSKVAAAGRAAAAMLDGAGLGWGDIILPDAALSAASATDATRPPSPPADLAAAATNSAEALVLIEQLLARDSLYEGTRSELVAYRDDIAAGEFDDGDLAYLNALYGRVMQASASSSGD